LPIIHLLNRADERADTLVRGAVSRRDVSKDEWRELKNLLASYGSIEYAHRIAVDFVERAKSALYAFPASPEREALMALPDYVLSRDR
jgi:octaprenyl-diphosphate synthase